MNKAKSYGLFGKIFDQITESGVAFAAANILAFSGSWITLGISAVAGALSIGAKTRLGDNAGRVPLAITTASTACLTVACGVLGDYSHMVIAGLFTAGSTMVISNTIQGLRGEKDQVDFFQDQTLSQKSGTLKRTLAEFVLRQQHASQSTRNWIKAVTTPAIPWNIAYSSLAVIGAGAHILSQPAALIMLGLGVGTTLVSAVGVASGKLKHKSSPFMLTAFGSGINATAAAITLNPIPAFNLVCAGVGEGRLGYDFWERSNIAGLKPLPAARSGPITTLFRALDYVGQRPLEAAIIKGYLPLPKKAREALRHSPAP